MGRFTRRLLQFSGAAAAAAFGIVRTVRTSSRRADEAAIRRALADMTAAFNRRDAAGAAAVYEADADFVNIWGRRISGHAAIEASLASLFVTRGKNAELQTTSVTVRFVGRDAALAHVANETLGMANPAGDEMSPHTELSLRVFVREHGAWHLAAFHNTLVA